MHLAKQPTPGTHPTVCPPFAPTPATLTDAAACHCAREHRLVITAGRIAAAPCGRHNLLLCVLHGCCVKTLQLPLNAHQHTSALITVSTTRKCPQTCVACDHPCVAIRVTITCVPQHEQHTTHSTRPTQLCPDSSLLHTHYLPASAAPTQGARHPTIRYAARLSLAHHPPFKPQGSSRCCSRQADRHQLLAACQPL
jgi:hypothetical protein